MTENEMVGWHHRCNGHEFEKALGVGDGQGSLAYCSPWGCKVSDMTEQLNNNRNCQRKVPGNTGGMCALCLHVCTQVCVQYVYVCVSCPVPRCTYPPEPVLPLITEELGSVSTLIWFLMLEQLLCFFPGACF